MHTYTRVHMHTNSYTHRPTCIITHACVHTENLHINISIHTHPQICTYTHTLHRNQLSQWQGSTSVSINWSLSNYLMDTQVPGPASGRSFDRFMRKRSSILCLLNTLYMPGPMRDTMTSETNNSGSLDPVTHEHSEPFLVLGT